MSTIILIRAGSTDYDNNSRLIGLLEMPMNQAGLQEMEQAANRIQEMGLKPEVILSAPEDPSAGTALRDRGPTEGRPRPRTRRTPQRQSGPLAGFAGGRSS